MSTPTALAAFDEYPQFILWRIEKRVLSGKEQDVKVPVSYHTGLAGDAHDPKNWLTYAQACEHAERLGCNVGYTFTKADPFFFIDLDDCLQADGTWSDVVTWFYQQFPGAACELSYSGEGLHLFGKYSELQKHRQKCPGVLELYTSLRFVALTFNNLSGDANTDHTGALANVITTYLPQGVEVDPANWTVEPVPEWTGYIDDKELIAAASRTQSVASLFGNKASFLDLWECNEDALAEAYPDSGARVFDHSSADAALVAHLAFWTGKDCGRIERLFGKSALVREKWNDRAPYRQTTILKGVANCTQVYNRKPDTPSEAPGPEQDIARKTKSLMFCDDQEKYFAGCIYVRDAHKVFVPDGELLGPGQFNATYGGWDFCLDYESIKKTKSAFEAFTESRVLTWQKVHSICFRPELPPGSIVDEGGRRLVNTYVPAVVPSVAGDVTPFEALVEKLLPDETDRQQLLAWMAAVVQYPGVKFQWAPLVQGTQGNGKTLLLSCLAEAIGRKYTHFPKADQISNKFNGWLRGKLLIGIEELKIGGKWELMEMLKPFITNPYIEIESKGINQVTTDNRANFFMCSNHRDAIVLTQDDRRYCMFFTAQQSAYDLRRDGMVGDYFPNLYRWLKAGGYANVTHWFQNYPIPAHLNPATQCQVSPDTTSTEEAIRISLGPVEHEILAAVEEERQGFRGGWISSIALSRLLREIRMEVKITRPRRADILRSLGYDKHPSLPHGKAPRQTLVDEGRPMLYIKKGGELWSTLFPPSRVQEMYEEAQEIA